MNDDQVLIRITGQVGRITLNRPDVLNALSHEMVLEIENALLAWANDPVVRLVISDGVGARGFCAGGDIEDIYSAGLKGHYDYAAQFWRDEYRLNALIKNYPKPYVAVMHGFVMGGGVGISAHGSHRIVTETSMVAMPECSIGLIPDVGGTHILGQAPEALGEFVGLTGFRLNAADAIITGFADYYVPSDKTPALIDTLSANGDIAALSVFAETPPVGKLDVARAEISVVFAKESVSDMMDALSNTQSEWAEKALKALQHAAPLSLVCALLMIRNARLRNNLVETLEHEFRFTSRAIEHAEFLEGIRAAIIDKDRNPQWRYATLDDIPKDLIERMLAPLEGV